MSKDLHVPTERIRNVLLAGHIGTGKTTLAEAMLTAGGVTERMGSTDDGTARLDFEPEEHDRHHSLALSVASVPWKGHKLNLLDAPGGVEAIGDAYPAVRAADVAVFVVDATAGLQPQHEDLWAACAAEGLPRVVFLNKLDKEGAGYQVNVDVLSEAYGKPFAPIEMPIGLEADFHGVIDLLHFNAIEVIDGRRIEEEVPEDRREQAHRNRELLVEAIVETDDELLLAYLEGDLPETSVLAERFAEGIAEAAFFPMLCGSATSGIGVQVLMDFLVEECPSPATRTFTGADGTARTASDEPAVYVFKTLSDPYVGRVNLLRVLSGGLKADATLTDCRTGKEHRLHQLFVLQGNQQLPVEELAAGDIVAVAKLDDVRTGDVLASSGAPFELPAPDVPEGYYRVAIHPVSAGDDDKLSTALSRIAEEDLSLAVTRDANTAALVLNAYGPTHVDVTLKRMRRKFGVDVETSPPPIAYRETLRGPGSGTGKHVKQTGGHGQFGVATIEVAPLERGAGLVFEDGIVGGVVPNQFIPSVEKGVIEAMKKGPLAGYPVVDVKVRLVDGKHHSVDSSDAAFQMAGILAFRQACDDAGMVLLEPMTEVDVSIPDEHTGAVMGDLSSRRGRILGTDPAGPGRTMVHAQVPEAEVLTYPAELRALTSGHGRCAMRYSHHDTVPDHAAKTIIGHAQEA
ncbi:MAG TPA: elongation factor G [Nitriliruptorales bacterium]